MSNYSDFQKNFNMMFTLTLGQEKDKKNNLNILDLV